MKGSQLNPLKRSAAGFELYVKSKNNGGGALT
jgi:hypothetical protein